MKKIHVSKNQHSTRPRLHFRPNCGKGITVKSLLAGLLAITFCVSAHAQAPSTQTEEANKADGAALELKLLTGTRQLTFEGRRAGEGYFSGDGNEMVFQSERVTGNPFFQIFVMDLETGDTEQISPGHGKTTCAWIHPDGKQVMYASTHDDAAARDKQVAELDLRKSGKERRYSWDYDETYELYSYDRESKSTKRLTNAKGYDAEGSWSPDGKWIAFASNRSAYEDELPDAEKKTFEMDKSFFNEIYIMKSDGTELKRLTTTPGYDGGPFFSPDGKRICWRRFSEDGALAEIMTMNTDGSDQKQITRLGAMSWAPYYHPSGEYLIFTTNRHGFANFELYIVDGDAKAPPVRVTHTKGFDGLPVFTPDGKKLAWTTNRNSQKQSQIYIADWNHEEAQRLLTTATSSAAAATEVSTVEAVAIAAKAAESTTVDCEPSDIMKHVDYLCRPELGGRLTGTDGERLATAYVAAYMDSLGLQPAGENGTWFQEFEFTAGISLGENNRMTNGDRTMTVDKDWRPLAFSENGETAATPVVWAGYGIVAPADPDSDPKQDEYDSFVHLDVKDKWVLCLRYMPENITPERRQHLARYSSLRFKAMKARDLGAKGLIIVSGPNSKVKKQLLPLRSDGSLSGSSIPVICVTDAIVDDWLKDDSKSLKQLQTSLDEGDPQMGFELAGDQVATNVNLVAEKSRGRNVLGILRAKENGKAEQKVVVGAHIDHLGRGTGGSLARGDEVDQIHFGADDNASGVAAMLEIAQYLGDMKRRGKFAPKRDVLFAAWSGEELGLLGANHFVNHFETAEKPAHGHAAAHGKANPHGETNPHGEANPHGAPKSDTHAADPHAANPHAKQEHGEHAAAADNSIYPDIAACLNLDMVGRFEKRLVLQGIGSSSIWKSEIEKRNAPIGLPITLQNDSYLPTDASAFFMRGVPILAAFTGSHSDYHTPRDTPEKLNYDDAARIAKFMGLVARSVATRDTPPDYIEQARPDEERPRAGLRVYLGTIPDYSQTDEKGVSLSGVAKNGPAAKAGVKGGDLIVGLAGKKIENIYDYTYAIDALKVGQKTKIIVRRDGKELTLEMTPGSRD